MHQEYKILVILCILIFLTFTICFYTIKQNKLLCRLKLFFKLKFQFKYYLIYERCDCLKGICVLCKKTKLLTKEHYPAKSVGNVDMVTANLIKMIDIISEGTCNKENYNQIFDEQIVTNSYKEGRVSETLCQGCNTFLGSYDETYKKFYDCDGDSNKIKGFSPMTKEKIIKSIYGKFLSVPECQEINFDFLDYLRNKNATNYYGKWTVYITKRDFYTGFGAIQPLDTGILEEDEGKVIEFSDEKFIFHLTEFTPPESLVGTNIWNIRNKNYKIKSGADVNGGYHAGILMKHFLLS